ncbi:kinesin-domain-containing protein [Xylariaceae sp. FL1272]|nr:kinesin-domain-containing protein [Xylariaceae sp. FL1272]
MATSPPTSPGMMSPPPSRPQSMMMMKPAPRSNSRLSMSSKMGGGSRASDEEGGRTAVKVAIRVRPPLKPTDPGFDLIPQRFQVSRVQTTSNTSIVIDSQQGKKIDSQQGKKVFVFDRVFSPETGQDGVWEYLKESINAFVQGYNVSLLAYGQSGAGKSYTMGTSGPSEQGDVESMGVIPRAATELFEKLEGPAPAKNSNRNSMSQLRAPSRYSLQPQTPKADRNWQLKATYVEIYNESLHDLLLPDSTGPSERGTIAIREDTKGNILLTGLRQMDINSVDDLMNALNFGSTIRQTDATAINAKSSRSHAVFTLNLVQRKPKAQTSQHDKRMSVPVEAMSGGDTWVTTDSKLHFVDLAGSERLKNTGAQGERAKEGININAGLAALGKVISQLSSRQPGSHVSYRDSKLTRLLQDSLGGNAITYMIACVTPAEFHLNETLNTVHYAQRARAIQSKPRIQQVEEGDKQAIIERLKAEVAFLREQIKSNSATEGGVGERRNVVTGGRSERHHERESDLQNQLLDSQENYTSLSKRHAKLISEMAKARNDEVLGHQTMDETLGDSATERLNRSTSFSQAVEQMVLEYETTIESLQSNYSENRNALSAAETRILQEETKYAYLNKVNEQLRERVQKLMAREEDTENYLKDLEEKLDGHTNGEAKNATIITELRKELGKLRATEGASEVYISTLEERLAEAEQDAELMQSEMEKLEAVIERQRSLGQLDSLLYELDHMKDEGNSKQPDSETGHGATVGHRRTFSERSHKSHASRPSQSQRDFLPKLSEAVEIKSVIDEESSEQATAPEMANANETSDNEPRDGSGHNPVATTSTKGEGAGYPPQSPAQNEFVNDKLETVSQELLDLRVEHENTMSAYDHLSAKYDEALRAMAEMQDQIDEARHPNRQRDSMLSVAAQDESRPPSFLSDSKSSVGKDETYISSRSLSSELSSAMGSPATPDITDVEFEATKPSESTETLTVTADDAVNDTAELAAEVQKLKQLASEREAAEEELHERYTQLEKQHQESLDEVEELKTELAKARYAEPPSPRSGATPVIRRKSSQNVMVIERAHRSFAALRNIAAENFESNPDVMQNFEVNLNSCIHELHARSERVQELEASLASNKKEMESTKAIISGLTRERSSLKASPVDISVVATLRDQLEVNEQQLKTIKELHEAREKELLAELETLRTSVQDAAEARAMSAPQPLNGNAQAQEAELLAAQEMRISELQTELTSWEQKHKDALEGLQVSEEQMKQSIRALESELATANTKFTEAREKEARSGSQAKETATQHQSAITDLQAEIDSLKSIIEGNDADLAKLNDEHAIVKGQLEEMSQSRDFANAEVESHKELIGQLDAKIAEHEQAIYDHEKTVQELHEKHAREIEDIHAASKDGFNTQVNILMNEHAENIKLLEDDALEARHELERVAMQVAEALGVDTSLDKLSERIDYLIADQRSLAIEQQRSVELEGHINELSTINNTIMRDLEAVKSTLYDILRSEGEDLRSGYPSVPEQLTAIKQKMADLEKKNKKQSRIVEELEDQLQTNFDQVQLTNNRLSTLQTERNTQIEEAHHAQTKAEMELEAMRHEVAVLQARIEDADGPKRTNSFTSQQQVRKTSSVVSLPSPPPAIPLPPLPAGGSTSPVPPTPTGNRPPSNELNMNHIREDQEARIISIEKHLKAERQLTATLEEALTDLENQSKKVKADNEGWKKRVSELESELQELRKRPQEDSRWRDSALLIEEERKKRQESERARAQLQERMNAINNKKKKKGSLNCF